MAQSRPGLRLLGALLAFGLVVGIGLAMFAAPGRKTTPSTTSPPPSPAPAVAGATGSTAAPTPQAPVAAGATGSAPTSAPASTAPATSPAAPSTVTTAVALPLSAKSFVGDATADPASWLPVGSLQPPAGSTAAPGFQMELRFNPAGAGVEQIALAEHFDSILPTKQHEIVQQVHKVGDDGMVPMALLAVGINDQLIPLAGAAALSVWRQIAPGRFEAQIVDAKGAPVATISRRFILEPGRYDFVLEQTVTNQTAAPLSVVWYQTGPADLPVLQTRGADVRRLRIGYVTAPSSDPTQQVVLAKRYMTDHAHLVAAHAPGVAAPEQRLFPTSDSLADGDQLAFAALTNRYFAVGVFALPDRLPKRPDNLPTKVWSAVAAIDRAQLSVIGSRGTADPATSKVALRLQSAVQTAAPGASVDFSMGVYAGPIALASLGSSATTEAMGLREIRVFTFGGPCGCCTFQPVAQVLRGLLGFLHDYVVFDWAVAIILMVLCVKTLLHPITFWAQSRMQRFGKQMSAIAPKIQKLKEKYGSDPAKFREEQMKLMREEEVSYAGALGCVPLMLQTPIWIALYAMIYFTFELRHEGAFYGVFQAISGGSWSFLGDLAEPDHFIRLGVSFQIPVLSWIIPTLGEVDSINLLPLLLGAVFFVQQKYLTPPSTTPLSPEQELTQKIMKVMIVVLFPLFMYNAPSALTIYFICNSSVGIIESRRIRRKVAAEDLAREEMKKAGLGRKGPAPEQPKGFFARMQDEIERRQKEAEAKRRRDQKGK